MRNTFVMHFLRLAVILIFQHSASVWATSELSDELINETISALNEIKLDRKPSRFDAYYMPEAKILVGFKDGGRMQVKDYTYESIKETWNDFYKKENKKVISVTNSAAQINIADGAEWARVSFELTTIVEEKKALQREIKEFHELVFGLSDGSVKIYEAHINIESNKVLKD